jgi:hypothetical protein
MVSILLDDRWTGVSSAAGRAGVGVEAVRKASIHDAMVQDAAVHGTAIQVA